MSGLAYYDRWAIPVFNGLVYGHIGFRLINYSRPCLGVAAFMWTMPVGCPEFVWKHQESIVWI